MKQISSYQAGCKLFNYASWNLLIWCFSSLASSVEPVRVGGLAGDEPRWHELYLSESWPLPLWQIKLEWLVQHCQFALSWGLCWGWHSDPGKTQFTFWVNQNARLGGGKRQQARAVNSKEAIYNLTQTSVLIRHSCSETALWLFGCVCRHSCHFHISYRSTQFVIQQSL